jgi:hypothetical protein
MFSTLSSPPPLCDGDGVSMRKTMFKRSSCFSLLGEEAGADLAPSVSAALVEAVAAAVVALGVESIAVPCAPPSSVGGLEAEAAALVAVAAVVVALGVESIAVPCAPLSSVGGLEAEAAAAAAAWAVVLGTATTSGSFLTLSTLTVVSGAGEAALPALSSALRRLFLLGVSGRVVSVAVVSSTTTCLSGASSPSSSSRLRFCPLVESLLRVLRVFFLLDIFLQAK